MRKWTVYILLVVCLSGCGRGNGNNQNDSSVERVGNNVPVEAIKVEKQNNYESKEYQDIINTRKIIAENEEIILPKPLKIDSIFEIPERVKQQRQPRTTPARDIIVEVFDTIPTNTEIYYYSPRMESNSYSYRKELGSDNNFLDVTDIYNKTVITVPDTCEQGTKLLFRAQGYEPLDLPMNKVYGKSHITIQLTPKIYNSTVILEEKIFRDTISIIEIINLHETPTKVFYGQCLPIYSDDGINHGDPYCAFACMGCYPKFDVVKEYYSGELDELKKLHQVLKKGENCTLAIFVDKRQIKDIEIEGCSNKALDNIRKFILTTQQETLYDGYRFEYRIYFAAR
ncbi:hypothetical protein [Bacteroides fragilis]|uniref:hypothetical protein n=1 Tax=Bacteroides fragilis TaxID=817 RepID=UPI00202F0447|nr:hypothetical protein [Bacteroides fragilis]MCM0315582.1 hypothetical protein [Bacteroides fragilis]